MEAPQSYKEDRPWGNFVEFTHNKPSTVKIITVNPHQALSLQKHEKRDEFWHVLSDGDGVIEIDSNRSTPKIGSEYFVPRGVTHRLEAGATPLVVLEISFGEFDESDIVRLEDLYGRASS